MLKKKFIFEIEIDFGSAAQCARWMEVIPKSSSLIKEMVEMAHKDNHVRIAPIQWETPNKGSKMEHEFTELMEDQGVRFVDMKAVK